MPTITTCTVLQYNFFNDLKHSSAPRPLSHFKTLWFTKYKINYVWQILENSKNSHQHHDDDELALCRPPYIRWSPGRRQSAFPPLVFRAASGSQGNVQAVVGVFKVRSFHLYLDLVPVSPHYISLLVLYLRFHVENISSDRRLFLLW